MGWFPTLMQMLPAHPRNVQRLPSHKLFQVKIVPISRRLRISGKAAAFAIRSRAEHEALVKLKKVTPEPGGLLELVTKCEEIKLPFHFPAPSETNPDEWAMKEIPVKIYRLAVGSM